MKRYEMKRYEWIFAFLALLMILLTAANEIDQSTYGDDLIRLHVIANSDSPEDQALKLQVRDRLLLTFGETFREVRSMEEARGIIQANLAALEQTACVEIENQGFSYPVEAKLGIYPFPTRVYGDLVYPAGNYEALRVVIGEGKGANWWCVMFPPLCFVDVSSGAAKQPQQENPKEADLSSPSIGEENTIVYTFKAAQLWKSFREWIGSF